MKKIAVCFLLISGMVQGLWSEIRGREYSVVFVHIGEQLPSYIHHAIAQAHLFNPDCDLVLIANEKAVIEEKKKKGEIFPDCLEIVYCESLLETKEHVQFQKGSKFKPGLWRYAIERFFYLDELIATYDLKNVFHLESDNMLYLNLGEILPVFHRHYRGMAAVYDNDERGIPSLVYYADEESSKKFAAFIAKYAKKEVTDMRLFALFRKREGKGGIDQLPIVMPEYQKKHPLKSPMGHCVKNEGGFYQYQEEFQSVFDAAAIGQFLGGIDPIHKNSQPGFINESCIFNPSHLNYVWESDAQGRRIPYMIFEGKKVRINNLHIHCKRLQDFAS
jgi:hypothetical protein